KRADNLPVQRIRQPVRLLPSLELPQPRPLLRPRVLAWRDPTRARQPQHQFNRPLEVLSREKRHDTS
ncbi:MAG: hypothetical protein ACXWDN_20910, partial [Limisphaerales bacterium]